MNYINPKTRITVSVIGTLLGLGGIFNHGIFEVLQGNTPTDGYFIEAISETHRFWIHGTEGAFTIIPNFLYSGILTMLVGLLLIIWSTRYIHLKSGPGVFLLLLILLTAVGGGIGHIILFLPTWAFATRINKPLNWWNRILSERIRKILSKLWIYGIVVTSVSWLIVMELGIFGYFPGQTDSDRVLNIVFIFLFSSVIFASVTFICGFAYDLDRQKPKE